MAETVGADGLRITVSEQATVADVMIAETRVGGDDECPLLELADVTRDAEFVAGTPVGGSLREGLTVRFDGLQASATLAARAGEHALRFTCELAGAEELPARGVLLRLNLPVDAIGWRWHNDMQTAREIGPGEIYENVVPLRAWPDLPEWTDKPSLRIGAANRNFCTALTGAEGGIALAVPLDQPCIFRTAYDADMRRLQLVYDLALSPDTREPNRWTFEFDLYPCEDEWGFRSALQTYYAIYPEFFERQVNDLGQWMAFTRLSQIDNVNEFRFGLQEGAPEVAYDDRIGVLDTIYLTHAGEFANIPGHDPESDPLPPHERLVEVMTEDFRARTGDETMYPAVGLHDAEGRLAIVPARVYGHIIAQFNLDPELPYGQWTIDRADSLTASIRERTGGELDGFYYDGLTSGLNYRTEHFKYADAPPLWDPVAEKPVLNNFFSSCDWARAAAKHFHERGQVTMMNGAFGSSFFIAPWLDFFGGETGLRISREQMNYARTITWHKPMLTLLKGNYEQERDHAQIELFMKRALAYGIFPGFFDWSPSGLGPGGRYWDHPEYYERDRDLFRKYLPLVQTLAEAGWEPVTHARSSNPDIFVERYGPADDGIAWLTLLNETDRMKTTTVTIDAAALGLDPTDTHCVELVDDVAVDLAADGPTLTAEVTLEADGVAMLQLGTPAQIAAWRLGEAAEVVGLGVEMQEADPDRPPIAFAWHPEAGGYQREQKPTGGWQMVFDSEAQQPQRAWQWAMLFQPEPAPVTLRVRASAQDLKPREGERVGVYIRHAWVSPSFSHYETEFLELPPGTYRDREFTHTIESEHPLRAIYLRPETQGPIEGRLLIDSITLDDRFEPAEMRGTEGDIVRDSYVENPDFQRWYELIPDEHRESLQTRYRALRRIIDQATKAVTADPAGERAREAILLAADRAWQTREWMLDQGGSPECFDRALRDMAAVGTHLGMALLAVDGVPAPRFDLPARVFTGSTTRALVRLPEIGLAVRQDVMLPPGLDGARVSGPIALNRQAGEPWSFTVLQEARAGDTVTITRHVVIEGPDSQMVLYPSHSMEVVRPLEVELSNGGTDPETGALVASIRITNHRDEPVTAELELEAGPGWHAAETGSVSVPPGAGAQRSVSITPEGGATAGAVEVTLTATVGDVTERVTRQLLYIPAHANLLRNPGFEDGEAGWSIDPAAEIVTDVAHSGNASLRLRNEATTDRTQASQTVTLNQQRPTPILVRAASRAEGVGGPPGREYALYVDIYYTDGTPLYGQIYPFDTDSADWQVGELIIEPEKPIRNVNVYLLLRGKSGTVWFDDVAVVEDPRRKGNIAREAAAAIDSAYSGYDAEPINDGIIYPAEDAHWTDESWASADEEGPHWIELRFDEPRTIDRVVIYWSRDGGVARTSREVRLQVPDDGGWRDIATARPQRPASQTEIALDDPVTAGRFRIYQPPAMGPAGRPNIMWVREVELFAAE